MERRFRVQSSTRKEFKMTFNSSREDGKTIRFFFRLTVLPALLLFLSQLVSAQEKLKITPVAKDLYVYTTWKLYGDSPYPSNSMYLVTSEGVILFDTPWDTTQYQPLLDSIEKRHNKKVIMCFATHFHDDRTAGLDYYRKKGIKTYSSKLTGQLCRENNKPEAEFQFSTDPPITYYFDKKAFIIHFAGEGHTKDNIVVWFDKQKILYGGCLVKSIEAPDLGNLEDASLDKYPATIKKLIKMFPKRRIVVPGHLKWSKDALEHTLSLLNKN